MTEKDRNPPTESESRDKEREETKESQVPSDFLDTLAAARPVKCPRVYCSGGYQAQ